VLAGEGELPVREAVEVVLGVVNELLGGPALLPEPGLYLVECSALQRRISLSDNPHTGGV
jgi:hypothetical protein